jgi:hypothetical protein
MTRTLIDDVKIGSKWRARLEFKLADMWVGCYWVNHGGFWDIWLCLIPCLPIHFQSVER